MTDIGRKIPLCLLCREPQDLRYRPFCSKACAYQDLQGWMSGRYVIAGESGTLSGADLAHTCGSSDTEEEEESNER